MKRRPAVSSATVGAPLDRPRSMQFDRFCVAGFTHPNFSLAIAPEHDRPAGSALQAGTTAVQP